MSLSRHRRPHSVLLLSLEIEKPRETFSFSLALSLPHCPESRPVEERPPPRRWRQTFFHQRQITGYAAAVLLVLSPPPPPPSRGLHLPYLISPKLPPPRHDINMTMRLFLQALHDYAPLLSPNRGPFKDDEPNFFCGAEAAAAAAENDE